MGSGKGELVKPAVDSGLNLPFRESETLNRARQRREGAHVSGRLCFSGLGTLPGVWRQLWRGRLTTGRPAGGSPSAWGWPSQKTVAFPDDVTTAGATHPRLAYVMTTHDAGPWTPAPVTRRLSFSTPRSSSAEGTVAQHALVPGVAVQLQAM